MRKVPWKTTGLVLALIALGAVPAPASDTFSPDGAGPTHPAAANGRLTELPHLRAHRLDGHPVQLDGRLDDPAWQTAEAATGFQVWDPTRGAPPSEETVFKITYDEHALYIGVACLEEDPVRIATQLCRRDRMEDSDQISLYIDSYHDHTTAYNFRINPSGSLEDRYVYNDGGMDRDWDAVWEARTTRDERGWYAEFRIPFTSLRYRHSGEMTWGFQLYRYMHGRGEDTAWVVWDRETPGFVSRFGEIRGLSGIPPTRQLEILPYFVQRTTDPAALGSDDRLDQFQNFGADVKLAVTSNLTLNATVQPDFGQVEADPAVLNLSPFETYYDEKRPFFIAGNRFFEHPNFRLFHSRRIGTGDENARIRLAGKLTGKTSQGFTVAGLYAATDVTRSGHAHNLFEGGERLTHFLVGRLGREFGEGAHRVNLMQTAVYKPEDRDTYGVDETRDAWTSGLDFDVNLHDRDYNVQGSVVGSVVDPAPSAADPSLPHGRAYGTAGDLNLRKLGGRVFGGVWGHWESDDLELNDAGFLNAPDEINTGGWIHYRHSPQSTGDLILNADLEIDLVRTWLYGAGEGADLGGGPAWSYGPGHPEQLSAEFHGWTQFRNHWNSWLDLIWHPEGVSKYETRTYDERRGPLMRTPEYRLVQWGFSSDARRRWGLEHGGNFSWTEAEDTGLLLYLEGRWNPTSTVGWTASLTYTEVHEDAQHIDNFASPGGGIGGVSYVFGEMDQRTVDLTLRANVLFNRDLSLELYAQPYLSVGDYRRARELARPDSYEFAPYGAEDFDVRDYDFRYSSVNVNAVLRWEYRPGSTFYLVWKQSRGIDEDRGTVLEGGGRFDNALDARTLLDDEPENVFLAKISYWFAR